jgi:hypothetical protein
MTTTLTASPSSGLVATADTSGNLAFVTGSSSQYTATLPASTGTVALTTSGTPVADYWYLNSTFSVPAAEVFLTTNLSQLNFSGTGVTASAMTQSSGTFTFPQTGLYRVVFCASFYSNTNTSRYNVTNIYASTNGGSTYTQVAQSTSAIPAIVSSSNTFSQSFAETQINVNNTSNIKVQFSVNSTSTVNCNSGGLPPADTYMIFTRLGNNV